MKLSIHAYKLIFDCILADFMPSHTTCFGECVWRPCEAAGTFFSLLILYDSERPPEKYILDSKNLSCLVFNLLG